MPAAATAEGRLLFADWEVFVLAGGVVGLLVVALIVLPPLVWHEKRAPRPAVFDRNVALEIAYTLVPLAVVAGLFAVTLRYELPVDRVDAHPASVVDVTAFRWSWRLRYPQSGLTVTGTPQTVPTLYLAAGRTTEIDLRSADVTHSLWVPAFLFKRDAIPGMVNRFDLTPARTGTYAAECAQFCGLDHALMALRVKVVAPQRFDRYVRTRGAILP